MTAISSQSTQPEQCRRLHQQVEQDGGTHNLSQTDRAFYQTFCESGTSSAGHRQTGALDRDGGIDESAHVFEDTSFGDPNAGRPDDPDDANPAHYGRAVTQAPSGATGTPGTPGTPRPAK